MLAKFIIAQSVDLRMGGERGGERSRRQTEEGGAGDQETSQPIYLTAIYHSESMCQQLCACFMVDWLTPPPCPKLYRRTLSALSIRNTSEPAGQLKGQISERL